jgi:hypothetical protein
MHLRAPARCPSNTHPNKAGQSKKSSLGSHLPFPIQTWLVVA